MKAFIFDMDGVLFDTEAIKAKSHSDCCAFWGKRVDPEVYKDYLGQSFDTVSEAFIELGDCNIQLKEYQDQFDNIYKNHIQGGLHPTPGLFQVLQLLGQHECKTAVVTSSARWMVDLLLKKAGIDKMFNVTLACEDVDKEKPSPVPYQTAIAKLAVQPANCYVFEDSAAGIQSATRAGTTAFGLRHALNGLQDFSQAKAEFGSFEDTQLMTALNDILSS